MAALMPTFLLFGWMAARPATAAIGSLLANFTSVQLALQSSYAADFASFANSSIALMLGIGLTGVICGIVRFLGTGWIARRLLLSNWATLAAVAARKSWQDRVAMASLMQHRLGPACPAHCRGSCGGEERRRQSSPAADGAEHHRCQAGEPRPVAPRKSGDRSAARASCCDIRDPAAGRLPDELLGQLDSTIAFTLQEPASEPPQRGAHRPRRNPLRAFPGGAGLSAVRSQNHGRWPHEIRT